jgi:hypothetical protein
MAVVHALNAGLETLVFLVALFAIALTILQRRDVT